jgi:hypothetical protein
MFNCVLILAEIQRSSSPKQAYYIYTAVHHSIWFEKMELAIRKQFICSSLNSLTYVIPFSSPVNQHHQHRPKYSVPISTNFRGIIEGIYGVIEEILEEDGKVNTNTIIMGEWNSVVGDEPYRNIVGPYGLGRKNHRDQMLINFCERYGLIVTNTWFRKPKRRLYTWKEPGDRSRHQLDYILVKHRFRNCVKDVQTLPGADIDLDHNLLVAKICTRLKKIIRFQKRRPQWDLEKFYTKKNSAGYSRRGTQCN